MEEGRTKHWWRKVRLLSVVEEGEARLYGRGKGTVTEGEARLGFARLEKEEKEGIRLGFTCIKTKGRFHGWDNFETPQQNHAKAKQEDLKRF